MKPRWIILSIAVAIAIAAWGAVAVTYFFFDPSIAVWASVVTVAALTTEGLLWVAAGVFGWGFLEKRRAALGRLRDRFFGKRNRIAD